MDNRQRAIYLSRVRVGFGEDRVVKAWDALKLTERKVYDAQTDTILDFALRPDGKQFAVRDHRNADDLRPVKTLSGGETLILDPPADLKMGAAVRKKS